MDKNKNKNRNKKKNVTVGKSNLLINYPSRAMDRGGISSRI